MDFFKRLLTGLHSEPGIVGFPAQITPAMGDLICVGGSMSVDTVLKAYTGGCFPWTGEAPIPWYSPNPRLVLFPRQFNATKNLRKLARRNLYEIRFDHQFDRVMDACGRTPRKGQSTTWITRNMRQTYGELHEMGIGHSVEVVYEGKLVGGLYGLSLGKAFFGESMFSKRDNTSKLALYALCLQLAERDFDFIDCQQVTRHLMSLGARPLPRPEYLNRLKRTLYEPTSTESWRSWSSPFVMPESASEEKHTSQKVGSQGTTV